MSKDNTSRDMALETDTGPGESSGRARRKMRQIVGKAKKMLHLKDFRTHDPVPPIANHAGSSSTPRIEDAPSGMEQRADPQQAIQDATAASMAIKSLSGHEQTALSAGRDAPADLDTADNFRDTYLQPLKIFDAVIGEIANVHPYAKMALGVLSCASKIILAQADRDEAVLELLKKLVEVYRFMTEDKDFRFLLKPAVLGRISQQTLECAHFITDYSETKSFWKRLGKNAVSETNQKIQEYSAALDALMQNFRDEAIRDVKIVVHSTGDEVNLNGMTYAAGAGLDTGKKCLEGTRTDILSDIMGWINSTGEDVPRMLWLSGPAGTGKSAIAHTIADKFIGVGGFGSCYCFDQAKVVEGRHEKIFTTIARNLADRHPEMGRALAEIVQNDTALKTTTDVFQQWQKFLIDPLKKLSVPMVGPVVIVIEALDESGARETRSKILSILAGTHRDPTITKITALPKNFRIIVTSRPLPDINKQFTNAQHILHMSMDDIPPAVAESDIRVYISQHLEVLPHVGDNEEAVLAKTADGLFEWARLACAFINEPPPGFDRKGAFNAVVSSNPAKRENLLYRIYGVILTGIMPTDEYNTHFRPMLLAKFRSVMGQLLGAAEPLSLASLNAMRSHLPDESDCYEVEVILAFMGSLLSGTTNSSTPIRPLHASFRDFLTEQSCSKEFFIDVSKAQRDLAFASLRMMEHGLRFNICDLKSSYLPNSEDAGLQERVETSIPPHLSYSSRFWITHVGTTNFDEELAKEVQLFFTHERLFFWLELLALINALSGAVAALPLIFKWAKDHSAFKGVSSTALDVQRFIQVFGGIISHSTPHLYVSALPFSPANFALSGTFSERFPNTLRVASGRDMNWPAAQTMLKHTGRVLSVSFSPDGTRIVTGSWDFTVRLWVAATGQPIGRPLLGHTERVNSVSFSPDGTRIVTGSHDRTVRLWDAVTGQLVGEPLRGHTDVVYSVSFSPDGTRIVTGSRDSTVRLWDAATGQPVGEPLRGHTRSVQSVSFSPDGTRIVTGSDDYTVRLWDAATGQPIGEPLQGHTHSVNSVSFSPDGTRIATGSYDSTVRLWDAATGQPVGELLLGHTDQVNSVAFSPDGIHIVTGSADSTVRLWDAATGRPVGEPLRGHTRSVCSVSFSPDGSRIVTGSWDSTARLWDAALTGQLVSEPLLWHTTSVNSVSFSPDGTRIVTCSEDRTVRLWDAVTGQPVGEPLRGHTGRVLSVSFSPDGTRIVTGSHDCTVRLWDAATGQPVSAPLRGHTNWVNSVSFSLDGTRIVTGSADRTVRLWDAGTRQPVGEPLWGHTDQVNSVSFSPDGTRIVTGSADSTVRLWDVATRRSVGEPLRGHTDAVSSVSFSPDGTHIATGSLDSTVQLWDTARGQPVGGPLRHIRWVNSVSFSPDGTRIVTGSADCTVRLWDVATGKPVGEPLWGHTRSVSSVSFSPDGARIVTSSYDSTVRLWDAATSQPLLQSADTHIIRFSSNSTHALRKTAELMERASHDDHSPTPFLLCNSGWMLGPNRRLLFWVPPGSRHLFYNHRTALVIPRGGPELDLSRMAHGQHWRECQDET